MNVQTGQVTGPVPIITGLAVYDVHEDSHGDFWLLAFPGRRSGQIQPPDQAVHRISAGRRRDAAGQQQFLADGPDFWVASSPGALLLRQAHRAFRPLYQHSRTEPDSLSDNSVVSIYRDRSGLLWVGTANGGVNILDLRQRQFSHYTHRPEEPESLSPGKVSAIHDSNGVLWVGSFPRALDRLDRKSGRIAHYVPGADSLSKGNEVNSILKDSRGFLGWEARARDWIGSMNARAGSSITDTTRDPGSLMNNQVICIYEDPRGGLWVGQFGGVSHFDPATERFTNYRFGPSASDRPSVQRVGDSRDRSGTLWLGTWAAS